MHNLNELKRIYALCAQDIYNDWHQDEDGVDDEVGTGGICDLIAEEACSAFQTMGLDAFTYTQEDPNHTWVVLYLDGRFYHIDIPFHVYEEYQGPFCFAKIPDVKFEASDVQIWEATPQEVACLLSDVT